MGEVKTIYDIIQAGGVIGLAAIALWAWWQERRANAGLQNQILKLAMAQVQTSTQTQAAVSALKDVLVRALAVIEHGGRNGR
jgi:hypothetical protein